MLLAWFGFILSIALDAPWYVYLIGFLCLSVDAQRFKKKTR